MKAQEARIRQKAIIRSQICVYKRLQRRKPDGLLVMRVIGIPIDSTGRGFVLPRPRVGAMLHGEKDFSGRAGVKRANSRRRRSAGIRVFPALTGWRESTDVAACRAALARTEPAVITVIFRSLSALIR